VTKLASLTIELRVDRGREANANAVYTATVAYALLRQQALRFSVA
jgi:hypothetical protein